MKVHNSEIMASVNNTGLNDNGVLIPKEHEKGVEAIYYPNGVKFVVWTTDKRGRQLQKEILIPWEDAKVFCSAVVHKCDWMEARREQ